eukprot:952756-Amorphochlora_amoeboformis.AAC.1
MAGGMRKRGPQRGTKKDLNRRRESKKGSNGCNDGRKVVIYSINKLYRLIRRNFDIRLPQLSGFSPF